MKGVNASSMLGWIDFNKCYNDKTFLYLAQIGRNTLKGYIKLYWLDISETEYKRLTTACNWFYIKRIKPQYEVVK